MLKFVHSMVCETSNMYNGGWKLISCGRWKLFSRLNTLSYIYENTSEHIEITSIYSRKIASHTTLQFLLNYPNLLHVW